MKNSEASFLIPVKQFADLLAKAPEDQPIWIHYAPFGRWSHPMYGTTYMTVDKANKLVKNFHDRVRGIDTMTDYEHGLDPAKGTKASGQIIDMQVRADGVWSAVKFTDTARAEIASGEWKYFSPEFYEEWTHPHTDVKFEAVPAGGGLTNKPWIKTMVPLNFSEIVVESDEQLLKYRRRVAANEDGTDMVEVTTDGTNWRLATTDEVVEWEHSEPGTGQPPQVRTDEDDRSGDRDGSGSRRDTPPPPPEGYPDSEAKEGSVVKLSKEAAEALGVTLSNDGEIDEQAVDKAVVAMFSELKPLREEAQRKDREKAFSEQFPDEYKELQAQRDNRLANEAKTFSEQYERMTVVEGEGDAATTKRTSKGLSALALDKVQATHKLLAAGQTDDAMKAFSEMMTVITSQGSIVDYSEDGSSRESANAGDIVPNNARDAAKAFSEKVREVQTEEGGPDKCSWGDALSKATNKYPELAKAYSEASSTHREA